VDSPKWDFNLLCAGWQKGDDNMGRKEDDEKAYTTYDGIVGRSFRRGMRKAAKADFWFGEWRPC